MKPVHLRIGDLWATGVLGAHPHGLSYAAAESRRASRSRWTLKPLPWMDDGLLRDALRPDFSELASLRHPTLALPVSFIRSREERKIFSVRSYVPGEEFISGLKGRPAGDLLPWLIEAAEALRILHRHGILHRNLKASNLILPRAALAARAARFPRVVLCDPALLRPSPDGGSEGDGRPRPSAEGDFPGSDLFDLGVIFYRLLGGEALDRQAEKLPASLAAAKPSVSPDLDRVVLKLLHPDPGARYQDSGVLVEDLRRLGRGRMNSAFVAAECFVGREAEMARAVRCLEDRDRGFVLAVSGEAGMGRSSFLRRVELEAQVRGFRTVPLNCFPETSAACRPLQGMAEALMPPDARGRLPRSRSDRSPPGPPDPHWTTAEDLGHRTFLRELLARAVAASAVAPTILIVDDLHLADDTTVEFIALLAREIRRSEGPLGARPPSLVVSYRTESPFHGKIKPLLDLLEGRKEIHASLELPPLSPEAVANWVERVLEADRDSSERARIAARCRGIPVAVQLTIQGRRPVGAASVKGTRAADRLAPVLGNWVSGRSTVERRLLEALAVLAKPAPPQLLRDAVDLPLEEVRSACELLVREGSLAEERGAFFIRHGSLQDWLLGSLPDPRLRALHRSIAVALRRRRAGSLEEIARHWLYSDAPRRHFLQIHQAARRLARSHEPHRALELYQEALPLLPRRSRRLRRELSLEAAEVCARIGEYRRGAKLLEAALRSANQGREAGRLHGRLGVIYHRAGDPSRGAFHLKRGLELLEGRRELEWFRERARIGCELAEIASNRNDAAGAEAICRRTLEAISHRGEAAKDPEVFRVRMVLLETLAHIHLRLFQYRQARELFETSLSLSEKLGAAPETSLILNNLGILHNQENRFQEAIQCYRRAEEISNLLGEDQILANIRSNLAVLYAKLGEPESADESLRRAERHESRVDSRRVRFLRIHSAGLVDLILGRYESAIENLKSAIALGEELKDAFVVAFDLVYLGECHLFRGESRLAKRAFQRALGTGEPRPPAILHMVAARKAALAALQGKSREARAAAETHGGLLKAAGAIPFLDAGDAIFLGWARRLLKEREEASEALERARLFFSRTRAASGEIHASLELAAMEIDRGDPDLADHRLTALRSRFTCGRGALKNPMLSARLLAYQARALLEGSRPDAEAAARLKLESECFLIGRQHRDLEALLRELEARIHLARRPGRAATLPLLPDSSDPGPRAAEAAGRLSPGAILGRSAAILEVVRQVRRLAPAAIPILVTGETGAGKEVVARAIHEEGPRRSGPFVAVNCAALPEALLEAELFGHRRGAFSGAEGDRDGLLLKARGGTFLFDEIGEMPSGLQAKILRVLDQSTVRPLGGEDEVPIDTRFISSTHHDLRALVQARKFREDLLHRLGAVEIRVPPLRERAEDLPILIRHFLHASGSRSMANPFEEETISFLATYPWPGNVRELRNVVLRLVLTHPDRVKVDDARALLQRRSTVELFTPSFLRSRPLDQLFSDLEREYLILLHADKGGDLDSMAESLGVSQRALYKRFRLLGIKPGSLPREGSDGPSRPVDGSGAPPRH